MLLNKHNLNIAKIIDKSESRYTLNAIQCSPEGTVATDGHRLAHVTLPAMNDEHFPAIPNFEPSNGHTGTFLLSGKSALEISKAIPKNRIMPNLNHAAVGIGAPDSETVSLAVTDLESPKVFTEKKVAGQYPNWQIVMPKAADAKLVIGFNPKYLMEAAKLAMDFGAENITIRLTDAAHAIAIDCKNDSTGQTMTQVIMPVRI